MASTSSPEPRTTAVDAPVSGASDLWILPDGRIYAHNLTPALARVLRTLNPEDETLRRRAASGEEVP